MLEGLYAHYISKNILLQKYIWTVLISHVCCVNVFGVTFCVFCVVLCKKKYIYKLVLPYENKVRQSNLIVFGEGFYFGCLIFSGVENFLIKNVSPFLLPRKICKKNNLLINIMYSFALTCNCVGVWVRFAVVQNFIKVRLRSCIVTL